MANGPKTNSKTLTGKMQALSREARSNQRRLLTAFGIDTDSDLLKFNQLKVCNTSAICYYINLYLSIYGLLYYTKCETF